MSQPFNGVPKQHPKIYFNDGKTISSVWFDPKIGTEKGMKHLVDAIEAAKTAFFSVYQQKDEA